MSGHSYGGQIITALGADAPNVVGLVYVAAFGLDEGESIGACRAGCPDRRPWRTCASTTRASPGCRRDDFVDHFAADVEPVEASVMHAVQQPLHTNAWRR